MASNIFNCRLIQFLLAKYSLDDYVKKRLTDDEARNIMKGLLGKTEIAQVKSLPREDRDSILRKVKKIDGISQRQIARVLGVSANLVFKA
ncbi:hypothetical protein ACVBAX_16450 [Robertmurraya sp. GLU-23]